MLYHIMLLGIKTGFNKILLRRTYYSAAALQHKQTNTWAVIPVFGLKYDSEPAYTALCLGVFVEKYKTVFGLLSR